MIIKKISSFAASMIKVFIIIFFSIINSKADTNNNKHYSIDEGILSIMYHRFNENKYPSTNIRMNVFENHIKIIKNLKYEFLNPNNFEDVFDKPKTQKKYF